ncbi:MAG: enoyl-ACP reductase [Chloroflexi bacterium]|nr:enoyl-ACP reductase [Chloroflexota bacterium]
MPQLNGTLDAGRAAPGQALARERNLFSFPRCKLRQDVYPIDLKGRNAVIFGVANHRSIAWAIAQALQGAGARLAIAYQNQRLKEGIVRLVQDWPDPLLVECDVAQDGNIARAFAEVKERLGTLAIAVHSIAYASREDLAGNFYDTSREGFLTALEISAFSFIPIARHAAELMPEGGCILTLTFNASQQVYPGYNVMGTAKAALEHEVRQLAAELGPKGVRVNALSPGPLDTLAARGIHGFVDLKHLHAERAPLRRNITHEEVGKAALFLLSDLSSGITGAILPVDGGYSIMGV